MKRLWVLFILMLAVQSKAGITDKIFGFFKSKPSASAQDFGPVAQIAQIHSSVPGVSARRMNDPQWGVGVNGLKLYQGDVVQTDENGIATIDYEQGTRAILSQKTSIVLPYPGFLPKNTINIDVVLLEVGKASVSSTGDAWIVTSQGILKLKPSESDMPAGAVTIDSHLKMKVEVTRGWGVFVKRKSSSSVDAVAVLKGKPLEYDGGYGEKDPANELIGSLQEGWMTKAMNTHVVKGEPAYQVAYTEPATPPQTFPNSHIKAGEDRKVAAVAPEAKAPETKLANGVTPAINAKDEVKKMQVAAKEEEEAPEEEAPTAAPEPQENAGVKAAGRAKLSIIFPSENGSTKKPQVPFMGKLSSPGAKLYLNGAPVEVKKDLTFRKMMTGFKKGLNVYEFKVVQPDGTAETKKFRFNKL